MIPSIDALRDAARIVLTVTAIALLTACGGGGGGFSGSTPASQYIKATNTEQSAAACLPDVGGCDQFGSAAALSSAGDLLVVGAPFDDSDVGGINQSQGNASPAAVDNINFGAVYTYVRNGTTWAVGDYIKASLPGSLDQFGDVLALSDDGNTLAVGVPEEDSNATGIDGNQGDNSKSAAGAVYVYARDPSGIWTQQAYIKSPASNTNGRFGLAVALSANGNRLAVGEEECLAASDGCVYVYSRAGSIWSASPAVLQASNAELGDRFGTAVALSDNGNTLAVGAPGESSNGSGESNNAALDAGAVYVYTFASGVWSQTSYVKPAVVAAGSNFGASVSLSASGTKLAVGAPLESTDKAQSGAAYIYSLALAAGVASGEIPVVADVRSADDQFGSTVALTGNGNALFVAASLEDGRATNLNGDATSFWNNIDPIAGAGAAYKFNASSGAQQTYIKALNTGNGDKFGESLAVNSDGTIYAIGATLEDGKGKGTTATDSDVDQLQAGAVYLFQ